MWWSNTRQNGFAGYSFMRRLKQLAIKIKQWGKVKKGQFDENKRAWIKEIDLIDKLEAEGKSIELHKSKRLALKADLSQATLIETQMWAQKCKRIWNHEGDENSSFFHKICTSRQRRSIISNVTNHCGQICMKDSDIAETFVHHFKETYADKRKNKF